MPVVACERALWVVRVPLHERQWRRHRCCDAAGVQFCESAGQRIGGALVSTRSRTCTDHRRSHGVDMRCAGGMLRCRGERCERAGNETHASARLQWGNRAMCNRKLVARCGSHSRLLTRPAHVLTRHTLPASSRRRRSCAPLATRAQQERMLAAPPHPQSSQTEHLLTRPHPAPTRASAL